MEKLGARKIDWELKGKDILKISQLEVMNFMCVMYFIRVPVVVFMGLNCPCFLQRCAHDEFQGSINSVEFIQQ